MKKVVLGLIKKGDPEGFIKAWGEYQRAHPGKTVEVDIFEGMGRFYIEIKEPPTPQGRQPSDHRPEGTDACYHCGGRATRDGRACSVCKATGFVKRGFR